jgi:hypothetical protein
VTKKYQPTPQQKVLLDAMIDYARRNGLRTYTITCRFDNNDIPEFLKQLDELERRSRESRLMIRLALT